MQLYARNDGVCHAAQEAESGRDRTDKKQVVVISGIYNYNGLGQIKNSTLEVV